MYIVKSFQLERISCGVSPFAVSSSVHRWRPVISPCMEGSAGEHSQRSRPGNDEWDSRTAGHAYSVRRNANELVAGSCFEEARSGSLENVEGGGWNELFTTATCG